MSFMDTDSRLLILRAELYAAVQTLKGKDAIEFWKLINEIHSMESLIFEQGTTR